MGGNGWNQFLRMAERPGGDDDVGKLVVGGGSIVWGKDMLNCDAPRSSGKNAGSVELCTIVAGEAEVFSPIFHGGAGNASELTFVVHGDIQSGGVSSDPEVVIVADGRPCFSITPKEHDVSCSYQERRESIGKSREEAKASMSGENL